MKRLRTNKKRRKVTSKQEETGKTGDNYFYIFGFLMFLYGASQSNNYLITFGLVLLAYAWIDNGE